MAGLIPNLGTLLVALALGGVLFAAARSMGRQKKKGKGGCGCGCTGCPSAGLCHPPKK